MAAGEPVTSQECKLYFTDDDGASPTWVEIKEAQNADWANSREMIDTNSRASGFSSKKAGLTQVGTLSFNYQCVAGADTVFNALKTAYLAGTHLRFAQMNGAIATAGSEGQTAWCQVSQMQITESEGGVRICSVQAEPTRHVYSSAIVDPSWLTVS